LAVDSSGNLSSASVNGDSSQFSISGDTIMGNVGTPYAGMAFTYTGTTSQSITVSSTQGLASQLYTIANNFGNTSTGSFQTLISNLETTDNDDQNQVDENQSEADQYQTQLQDQYAEYQAQIETADNSLTYLQALLQESNSSS
jgi:flagellar hook-associated protein 2